MSQCVQGLASSDSFWSASVLRLELITHLSQPCLLTFGQLGYGAPSDNLVLRVVDPFEPIPPLRYEPDILAMRGHLIHAQPTGRTQLSHRSSLVHLRPLHGNSARSLLCLQLLASLVILSCARCLPDAA